MDSQVMAVPIFTGVLIIFAVILGLTIGRSRKKKIQERINNDTTDEQVREILTDLFKETSLTGVPVTMGLTSGQLAAGYGKDFAKSAALSALTGRKVHAHTDYSGDDTNILAYNSTDIYLVSILKDYNNMKITVDKDVTPLHLNHDNVKSFKYSTVNGSATVVLKDNRGKFSLTPGLSYFDKPDQERKQKCKEFLKEFAREF